jgi:ubiquinone/menaquinone biosynthesis C-methylase UbiE
MAVATEAEEELRNFLRKNLDETRTVLELGCGTARNLQTICSQNLKFNKYLGLDFSPQMLAVARSKFGDNPAVEFQEQDITEVNYTKEKFDIILCTWVLSYPRSASSLVNKAQGWLKPGGKLFLIFSTRSKWYVNFWLHPIATHLFSAKPVDEEEVRKFNNIKSRHSYAAHVTTVVEIWEGVGKPV